MGVSLIPLLRVRFWRRRVAGLAIHKLCEAARANAVYLLCGGAVYSGVPDAPAPFGARRPRDRRASGSPMPYSGSLAVLRPHRGPPPHSRPLLGWGVSRRCRSVRLRAAIRPVIPPGEVPGIHNSFAAVSRRAPTWIAAGPRPHRGHPYRPPDRPSAPKYPGSVRAAFGLIARCRRISRIFGFISEPDLSDMMAPCAAMGPFLFFRWPRFRFLMEIAPYLRGTTLGGCVVIWSDQAPHPMALREIMRRPVRPPRPPPPGVGIARAPRGRRLRARLAVVSGFRAGIGAVALPPPIVGARARRAPRGRARPGPARVPWPTPGAWSPFRPAGGARTRFAAITARGPQLADCLPFSPVLDVRFSRRWYATVLAALLAWPAARPYSTYITSWCCRSRAGCR